MSQLKSLEEQNVSHLGITAEELQRLVIGSADNLEKAKVYDQINDAVIRSKNMPPKKSVALVLSVCEDILCQSTDSLTAQDKEVLLGTMAQYSAMKRRYEEQEKAAKTKKSKDRGSR
jgi:Fe-S cluster assembly scaffold protein SufB